MAHTDINELIKGDIYVPKDSVYSVQFGFMDSQCSDRIILNKTQAREVVALFNKFLKRNPKNYNRRIGETCATK